MNKTTHTIVVAVVTIIAVLSVQTVWHHYYPPDGRHQDKRIHKPLSSQDSVEARQAARDFFNAMRDGDWAAVAKSWPPNAPKGRQFDDIFNDRLKDMISGLEIVSMGAPYREGGNPSVLIPYEVRFKSGDTQSNNLRMMKDSAGQSHWEGGF
jgi:hypothetical protein